MTLREFDLMRQGDRERHHRFIRALADHAALVRGPWTKDRQDPSEWVKPLPWHTAGPANKREREAKRDRHAVERLFVPLAVLSRHGVVG